MLLLSLGLNIATSVSYETVFYVKRFPWKIVSSCEMCVALGQGWPTFFGLRATMIVGKHAAGRKMFVLTASKEIQMFISYFTRCIKTGTTTLGH